MIQPSKFALALGNCEGFCQRRSVFLLMCIDKLLLRQNCLNNIYVKTRKLVKSEIIFFIFSHFLSKLPWLQLSLIKKMKEKTNKVWSIDKTLVGMEESAGAVIWGCSVNKMSWKIVENSLRKIHRKIPYWSLYLMKL